MSCFYLQLGYSEAASNSAAKTWDSYDGSSSAFLEWVRKTALEQCWTPNFVAETL